MNKIKFRARISENTIITFSIEDLIVPIPNFSIRELVIPWLLAGNKPDLYIGINDKYGKEIYEGDNTNQGTVEWCNCLKWDSGGSKHPGFYFKDKYYWNEKGELDYHVGFDEDMEIL